MPLFQTDIAKGTEAALTTQYAPELMKQQVEQGNQLLQQNALKLQSAAEEASGNVEMKSLTESYGKNPENAKKPVPEKMQDLGDIAMKAGRIKEAEKFYDMSEKAANNADKATELKFKTMDAHMERAKMYIEGLSSAEDWPKIRMAMQADGLMTPQEIQQVDKDLATIGFGKTQEKWDKVLTSAKERIAEGKQKMAEKKEADLVAHNERESKRKESHDLRIEALKIAGQTKEIDKMILNEYKATTPALAQVEKERVDFVKENTKPTVHKDMLTFASTTREEEAKLTEWKASLSEIEKRATALKEKQKELLQQMSPEGKKKIPKETKDQLTPSQEDWISRAMESNKGMSRDDIIKQGKKIGKL